MTLTLLIAIGGLGLSLFNSWVAWKRDRISIKVIPKLYTRGPNGMIWDRYVRGWSEQLQQQNPMWCIEVQNHGAVAVRISLVGFGQHRKKNRRYVITNPPLDKKDQSLPYDLEPQTAVIAYTILTPKRLWDSEGQFDFAFAETATDKVFRGSSPVLRHVQRILRQPADSLTTLRSP